MKYSNAICELEDDIYIEFSKAALVGTMCFVC